MKRSLMKGVMDDLLSLALGVTLTVGFVPELSSFCERTHVHGQPFRHSVASRMDVLRDPLSSWNAAP